MTRLFLTTAVALALGTSAFAKAHDQGQTETPGENVGSETVINSQGVAVIVSGGKGKGSQGNGGKSATAGR